MSRSQLSIKMFPKALQLAIENLELVRTGSHPWTQWNFKMRSPRGTREHGHRECEDIAYASALLFANYRLRSLDERGGDLLNSASGLLQKYQRNDGSWPYFSEDKESSIEATAMGVHALALHRPVGWERNLAKAVEMLKGSQKEGGYWYEDSCPDPTYLTVLVLDALELANSGKRVTFGPPSSTKVVGQRREREFSVALSFPGEARSNVEPVAERLVAKLGKGKVFYDNYFKHRLAQPDLDILLQQIYSENSDLVVVWVSSDYERKEWCCNVEWPAIRTLIKEHRGKDIMFLSLDKGRPRGFLSNIGFVDVKEMSSDQVSDLILKRIEEDAVDVR